MSYSLPISPAYRQPVFDAIALQVVLGLLSAMILDGGDCRHICGVALLAFWAGAVVLISRHPRNPTKTDLTLFRIGYVPVLVLAYTIIHLAWLARGF
jgi:hypothetical protein